MLLGLFVPLAVFAQGNTNVNSDAKQIQGAWRLIYQQSQGNKLPDEKTAEMFHGQITFDGNNKMHYTVELPGFDFEFSYKLDTSRQPKWIDMSLINTPKNGNNVTKLLGIYQLGENTLDICYGITNRPIAFSADAGSDNVLIRLKR